MSSQHLDWANAIGLFLINFGTLDLLISYHVETLMPPEEFDRIRDWHLRDRIQLITDHLQKAEVPPAKRAAFEKFFARLDPIRELRNLVAHGAIRLGLADDLQTWEMTLTLPRTLCGTDSPDDRHVSFVELTGAGAELTTLVQEFYGLSGQLRC